MKSIFSEQELTTARLILAKGFSRSAESLAHFIKVDTNISMGQQFAITDAFDASVVSKRKAPLFLLTSELIGDLNGVSFLIFSEEEANTITKTVYPNKNFSAEKFAKKRASLLLEIDNIITAGVVSEFANAFNYRTYGGVPELQVLNHEKVVRELFEQTKGAAYMISFSASLVAQKVAVNADFIWSVGKAFVTGIKDVQQQQQ